MKILVAGGGTGGHVTPVIAVAREIWQLRPRAKIEFWTDKKYYASVRKIAVDGGLDLRIKKVAAGKLRRYTSYRFADYLVHFDVVLANVADAFRLIGGFCQSLWRLLFLRPDAIFLKGGYACLPIGLAAQLLRIPYVIHDSDAVPGLTNRLLASKAVKIATGMPLQYYHYAEEKAEWTGIPVGAEFKPVSEFRQKQLKKELGFDPEQPLVVVTGGSQGAQGINFAVRKILPRLLKSAGVILVAGRARYDEMLDLKAYEQWSDGKLASNFLMLEFCGEMYRLFGAADVVISRAGASTIAELAAIGKAVVMVPFEPLPGFHQVRNAEAYATAKAALVVPNEEITADAEKLLTAVRKPLRDLALRAELARNLRSFAKGDAAKNIAEMVIKTAVSGKKH